MTSYRHESSPSLALIHTVSGLVPVFRDLAERELPKWTNFAMVDESLLTATIRDGVLSELTRERLAGQVQSAVHAGADAIVVTCSTLGGEVDALRAECPVPLLRIDRGMAEAAVRHGGRIGVLATLHTTLAPTTELIRSTAEAAGLAPRITARLTEGAFSRLAAGDTAGHDTLVAEALAALADESDVIVLAQASMARVLAQMGDRLGRRPVLTSPELGMAYVRAVLAAQSA
ncbi:MAG: aspartate/glutamate racemase family protein [Paracoccaceae bacterium]|nr:aspartate/glutamate racemase family protein [Paracoccaceae bacterium]